MGSSANITLGRETSARGTATRCCWPSESSDGRCPSRSVSPTVSISSASHAESGLLPASLSGRAMFSAAVSTVAQRTREFATLRTLGASRKQVMRSVKLEGLVIGLVASVIGLVLGYGIAKGMVGLFGLMGVELPKAGTVIASHTIWVSLILGTTVTLLASIVPARRATRVPPIAAVREGAVLPASKFAAHALKTGVGVLLASLAAITAGILAGGVSPAATALLLGVGVLGLSAGIALLALRLVKPLARVVGWPAGRRAGGRQLGPQPRWRRVDRGRADDRAHARDDRRRGRRRDDRRDAVGDHRAGPRRPRDRWCRRHAVPGRRGRQAGGDPGCHGGIAGSLRRRHRAGHAAHDQRDRPRHDRTLLPVQLDDGLRPYAGAARRRRRDRHQKLRRQQASDDRSPSVDQDAQGRRILRRRRGIYEPPTAHPMLADVLVTQTAFDSAYSQPKNSLMFLDADAGSAAAIKAAAHGYGDAAYHTGATYPKDATKDMATVLAMLYVLLGFSVIVSLFGMVNTMVLSVFERTREIGMLRTIGMTRRQARRMIRHESIITALIGAVMGLALGLFLAGLVTQAVGSDGLPLAIPVPTLAAFTLLAILAGIGAAVMPARRASRLNVLEALQYE